MIDKEKLNEEIFSNAVFAISMKAPGYFVSIDVKGEMDIEVVANFLNRFRTRLKNRGTIIRSGVEANENSKSALSPCMIPLAVRKNWRPRFEAIENDTSKNMQSRAMARRLLFIELTKEA